MYKCVNIYIFIYFDAETMKTHGKQFDREDDLIKNQPTKISSFLHSFDFDKNLESSTTIVKAAI